MVNELLFSNIIKQLQLYNPDIIYMAVGCSMINYQTITTQNNQQNPLFMEKFKRKFYIFFDPLLETPLKIESQINFTNVESSKEFRIFSNNEYFIIAINTLYNYNENDIFIITLISYILDFNKKMILQDYTGNDISKIYLKLFNVFPKDILIKKVIFDITQHDGGCFVDFNNFPIFYDINDDFIQPRFMTLINIKKDNIYYNKIAIDRMNLISYNLSRYIKILNKFIENTEYEEKIIKEIIYKLSIIYPIKVEITLDNIKKIIVIILSDIIISLQESTDIIDNIVKNDFDQSEIINYISKLKNLT